MKTIENGIHYYPWESDAKEGFFVRPPIGPIKAAWFIIHGVGEFGPGDLDSLKNIALGFDYDGPGPLDRQYALMTPELKAQADAHGHLIVFVNYNQRFDPSDFDYVQDTVQQDFPFDKTKWGAIGFSWGGRELMRFLTSSAQRAARFAFAVGCAPVNPGGNLQYIVDAKLQFIGTTHHTDPRVAASNVRDIIAGINKLNPAIKPVYIEWPGDAHGTFNQMLAGTDPLIPQSMFDYLDSVSTTGRKQYPTGGATVPPTVPPTTGTAMADFNLVDGQAINTNTFELDASASTGAKDYFWNVEVGTGSYSVKPEGGAFGGPKKKLLGLGNGTYFITLSINNYTVVSTRRKLVVSLGIPVPEPKTFVAFNSATDLITWSDGSTEKGEAQYVGGKWIVKNAAGQVIQL